MMITLKDGRTLQGTALQIVLQMKSMAFNGQGDLADYVRWVVDNSLRYDDADLKITGETDDEKAASLISEMLRTGLATKS